MNDCGRALWLDTDRLGLDVWGCERPLTCLLHTLDIHQVNMEPCLCTHPAAIAFTIGKA